MNTAKDVFIKIYREFGLNGLVAYLAGSIILVILPTRNIFEEQLLFSLLGLGLLVIGTAIFWIRVRASLARDKAFILMVQDTNNRLAEQIGKNLTKEQTEFISQKIRQTQREVMDKITNQGSIV